MPILGVIASSISGNLYSASYDSIASTVVGAGGASDVTFSSIPAGYTHLHIRYAVRSAFAAGTDIVIARVNGDSGNNYAAQRFYSDGSAAASQAFSPQSYLLGADVPAASASASFYGTGVWEILDYANTNKTKVMRAFGGRDQNGSGYVWGNTGFWINTNAITSISFFCGNGAMVQNSVVSLYGIKVA